MSQIARRYRWVPTPPARGVDLPYAQPGSPAGHLVILLRRYGCWWRDSFWPADKENIVTYGMGMILALVIGLVLGPAIFWLVFLTLALTLLAGLVRPDLGLFAGGRMQSVTQFLLPWLMGAVLWTEISWLVLVLGLAYWAVYLGGLQLLDKRQRAEWLFYLGQSAATILLLSLRLLPGAVVLAVLLVAQLLTRTKYDNAAELLQRSQAYVVIGLLVASASIGGL